MKKKKISQQKIAKELGVSQTLVSMVLNGRKSGISKDSVKRIWDYAQLHGYAPKGMQIDMSGASEGTKIETVGYILRSPLKLATKSNFFSLVHQGMHEELSENGIKTLFFGGEDDLNEHDYEQITQSKGFLRGIVVLGQVNPSVIHAIGKSDLPVVCISARYSGLCHSVLPNEAQAGENLVEHLYNLGHRRFGWLGGNKNMMRQTERYNSFTQSLQSRQLSCAPKDAITLINADRQDGFDAAKSILSNRRKMRPTALICYNGMMARGAVDYLLQNRIAVGKDISVAAFDYTRVCEDSLPKITCCGSSPEEMGATAARLIIQSSEKVAGAFSELTLPTQFRERESTGPAPSTVVKSR
ncbi:MAG: LacI family transcriptional regulator [Opitutales bacterium]|nr:LacI family transcriptional regulator [Opitutales bacterium]MDP4644411.1 LacI family transcriptional regulator [Opitutales bacterium]MDP4777877.1 LacI family transcriptional regulator [Opitutales bacterium]MDP5079834.1 LacI family transcriptional regulator [Opitutales bacterium]